MLNLKSFDALVGESPLLLWGITITRPERVPFDSLDLKQEWETLLLGATRFLDHLREIVAEDDVDAIDDIVWCRDCNVPLHSDHDEIAAYGDYTLCQTCREDNYSSCDDCDDVTPDRDMHSVEGGTVCGACRKDYTACDACRGAFHNDYGDLTYVGDDPLCGVCLARQCSWCEDCDAYYYDTDAASHEHNAQCGCESPRQHFGIANGQDVLSNDERTTVTLPAGVISPEGIGAIARYLRMKADEIYYAWDKVGNVPNDYNHVYSLSYQLADIGDKWQAKEGNFTKRLSRFAYKKYGYKIPSEIISEVGNIARQHSASVGHHIEVTRRLNLPAEDFCHEESCWWQSYGYSRCTLKSNGGFGLRSFASTHPDSSVTGRAWVFPLRRNEHGDLVPTFSTTDADAFLVFNGYGALSDYVPARLLSHMLGMTYRKITYLCDEMYVNNDSGYLVAPEEIADGFTDGSLALRLDRHSSLYNNEGLLTHV